MKTSFDEVMREDWGYFPDFRAGMHGKTVIVFAGVPSDMHGEVLCLGKRALALVNQLDWKDNGGDCIQCGEYDGHIDGCELGAILERIAKLRSVK